MSLSPSLSLSIYIYIYIYGSRSCRSIPFLGGCVSITVTSLSTSYINSKPISSNNNKPTQTNNPLIMATVAQAWIAARCWSRG